MPPRDQSRYHAASEKRPLVRNHDCLAGPAEEEISAGIARLDVGGHPGEPIITWSAGVSSGSGSPGQLAELDLVLGMR